MRQAPAGTFFVLVPKSATCWRGTRMCFLLCSPRPERGRAASRSDAMYISPALQRGVGRENSPSPGGAVEISEFRNFPDSGAEGIPAVL
jgi:hypothetical protein